MAAIFVQVWSSIPSEIGHGFKAMSLGKQILIPRSSDHSLSSLNHPSLPEKQQTGLVRWSRPSIHEASLPGEPNRIFPASVVTSKLVLSRNASCIDQV
ncbi:hypothetical protein KCU59_g149, partial [Aureobasidium melanogenum]